MNNSESTFASSRDLGERFVQLCRMTDEWVEAMSRSERDRLRRVNLSIVKGPRADRSFMPLEDQILVVLDWSHHMHYPGHLEAACELARLHSSELDWDDLAEWADRFNVEWALPRLRKAAAPA